MRRTICLATFVAMCLTLFGQTLNVKKGNIVYQFAASQAGDMVYDNASTLTVMGATLAIGDITKMYVDDAAVSEGTVAVDYEGSAATVRVSGDVARYVSISVDGKQSEEVGDDTCGEITYILSGSSEDGGFCLEGDYKASIELHGLSLYNPTGAPIDIQNGKRISVSVKSETENTLRDATNGSQKGCLVCKGHLEMKGKGVLNIYGNTSHAIYAKEYIEMKNCKVNVMTAVKDGVNCNQYFLMESGTLNISGIGDDGVQVSYKDDSEREEEDTGSATITGGVADIKVTATAAKGIKADGNINVGGGTLCIVTSGGGQWDAEDVKTSASACLSADGDINISAGTLTLTSSGSGGKGISCDNTLNIDGGDITIRTSGGVFAYINGNEYDNYTGSTDRIASDYKSSPKGMKTDGKVVINGGHIDIMTTGIGGEGIESKSTLTVNGGVISVYSSDDALNSSSHMYLNGGDITAISTGNDGIDSNGNLYVTGGVIRTFGGGSMECGIDAADEGGYSVILTGGVILAVGGNNSVPSSSLSTQPYVTTSGAVSAGKTIELRDGSKSLASFTVPENYGGTAANAPGRPGGGGTMGGSILVSCDGLSSGSSYTLVNGTSSATVTATLKSSGSGGGRW